MINPRVPEILKFIQVYYRLNGYMPTIREIGDAAHVSSTSVTRYYLDQLEKQGHIKITPAIARGIQLVEKGEAHGENEAKLCSICGWRRCGGKQSGKAYSNPRVPTSPYAHRQRQQSGIQARSSEPKCEATENLVAKVAQGKQS